MRRRIAAAGLALAGVLVASLVIASQTQPVHTGTADATRPSTTPPAAVSSAPSTSLPVSPPHAAPVPEPGATTPPGKSPTKAPGTGHSTEVLPPPNATGAPLRESKPLPALLTLPLPATASASGAVVAGFPITVIPAAPDSIISGSSVSTEGVHLQAALTARTTLSVQDVLDYYRSALAPYGLYDSHAPALGESTAVSFTRGANTVSVTLTSVAGGSSYTVFGALTASS